MQRRGLIIRRLEEPVPEIKISNNVHQGPFGREMQYRRPSSLPSKVPNVPHNSGDDQRALRNVPVMEMSR
jgi:hypothetical protein